MLGGSDSVEQARYNAIQMAQVCGTVVLCAADVSPKVRQ
jgi:hypothetical protein